METIAKITKYRINETGTDLLIHTDSLLQEAIESKNMKYCLVRFDDGRHITIEQRKKAYATIKDIAEYIGDVPEAVKDYMKALMIATTGCEYFSLSDCSIDTAREYINTLIDFALKNGVPLEESGVNRTDDIDRYLYSCLKYKRCAVCGRDGEIHHCEGSRIGMGGNRRKTSNKGRQLICLCRKHHTELHSMSEYDFMGKYKIYGLEDE